MDHVSGLSVLINIPFREAGQEDLSGTPTVREVER
jgi:hypothetical protein